MFDLQNNGQKKMRSGTAIDIISRAVVTVIFILSLFLNVVFIVIIIVMSSTIGAAKLKDVEKPGYKKVYIDSDYEASRWGDNELAVIGINGIITDYDTNTGLFEYSENPVSAVKSRLDIIKKDENVKGVLFVIDSPGGGITASDILYREILKFKEETGLPILTLMKQVAASGAYYVASATDYILAYPTTITGNIGVIMYYFNFNGLMDKYGVKYVAIKSSDHKDILSPFKGIDEKELMWMQSIVDQMLEKFIEVIGEGRKNLTISEVRKLADGRVYIAKDALANGLIDEIGYFEDAVRVLSEKAGIERPGLIEYERERNLRDVLSWAVLNVKPGSFMDILDRDQNVKPYGMYFLWDSAALFTN